MVIGQTMSVSSLSRDKDYSNYSYHLVCLSVSGGEELATIALTERVTATLDAISENLSFAIFQKEFWTNTLHPRVAQTFSPIGVAAAIERRRSSMVSATSS
jgi:hypothetical protein